MVGQLPHDQDFVAAPLSLLFQRGDRPSANSVRDFLDTSQDDRLFARISAAGRQDAGELELLCLGLTFDLVALQPADPAPPPPVRHLFGLNSGFAVGNHEAVLLSPGPHLAGAGAMMPVVRSLVGLAASLAVGLNAQAVCWHPAATCSSAEFFAKTVSAWLDGGAFPGLGLTALTAEEGGIATHGLSYFIGQEAIVVGQPGEQSADTAKAALRIIDALVARGGSAQSIDIETGDDAIYRGEPEPDTWRLRFRRS